MSVFILVACIYLAKRPYVVHRALSQLAVFFIYFYNEPECSIAAIYGSENLL